MMILHDACWVACRNFQVSMKLTFWLFETILLGSLYYRSTILHGLLGYLCWIHPPTFWLKICWVFLQFKDNAFLIMNNGVSTYRPLWPPRFFHVTMSYLLVTLFEHPDKSGSSCTIFSMSPFMLTQYTDSHASRFAFSIPMWISLVL